MGYSNPHVVDVNITRFDLLMTSLWAPLRMAALYGVLWLALFATNVYQMMKLPRFHWATGEVVRMVVVADAQSGSCIGHDQRLA